jgi:hypothetical protein
MFRPALLTGNRVPDDRIGGIPAMIGEAAGCGGLLICLVCVVSKLISQQILKIVVDVAYIYFFHSYLSSIVLFNIP